MIYAVEFMPDNHKELCQRMGVSVDHPHYVCADALNYHYNFNGRPEAISVETYMS